MTISKAEQARREAAAEEARTVLRSMIENNTTVYTILRHVSTSGMTRVIDPMIITDGELHSIRHHVANLLGVPLDKRDGIKREGAGMDMGFDLVYSISRALWPEGYECIGEGCPGNDHSNQPYPARVAGSMHHSDGGSRLSHRWV